MEPKWLEWARGLQAIAQNGIAYSKDPFDIERFESIRKIAAEIMARHTDVDSSYVRGLFDGEKGPATPKLDVRGIAFRDDKILLVRERRDRRWTPPGGWADVGESPAEAVEREVLEESGFRTRAQKLLALYDKHKHEHPPHQYHAYKLFFLCEIIGGEASPSMETVEVAFFGEDEIPELSVDRVTPGQISRLFELYRHPNRPTDFDKAQV